MCSHSQKDQRALGEKRKSAEGRLDMRWRNSLPDWEPKLGLNAEEELSKRPGGDVRGKWRGPPESK